MTEAIDDVVLSGRRRVREAGPPSRGMLRPSAARRERLQSTSIRPRESPEQRNPLDAARTASRSRSTSRCGRKGSHDVEEVTVDPLETRFAPDALDRHTRRRPPLRSHSRRSGRDRRGVRGAKRDKIIFSSCGSSDAHRVREARPQTTSGAGTTESDSIVASASAASAGFRAAPRRAAPRLSTPTPGWRRRAPAACPARSSGLGASDLFEDRGDGPSERDAELRQESTGAVGESTPGRAAVPVGTHPRPCVRQPDVFAGRFARPLAMTCLRTGALGVGCGDLA